MLFLDDLPGSFTKKSFVKHAQILSNEQWVADTSERLSGYVSLGVSHAPAPSKAREKVIRVGGILENPLFVLENVLCPLSIHRTFSQP